MTNICRVKTVDGYFDQDGPNQKKHNINHLIKTNNFTKYLEIGVNDPVYNFDEIICKHKHSVDPCVEFVTAKVDYKNTSDDFFELLDNSKLDLPKDYKWDVIFIDGLHQANQVERDFDNAFKHLSDNGFILVHDTNPPTLHHAREDYILDNGNRAPWNGTVWKCIYKLNATRKDLVIHTVGDCKNPQGFDNDICWGLSIINRGEQECCDFDNSFYEYREFEKNRDRHLNMISIDDFYEIYK
jgi:hypothetical protein